MFLLSRNSVNAFNYAMRYNYRIFKHLTCINESNWRVCAFTDRRVIKVRGGGLFLHTCYAKEGKYAGRRFRLLRSLRDRVGKDRDRSGHPRITYTLVTVWLNLSRTLADL